MTTDGGTAGAPEVALWPAGAATGVGSLPGIDPLAAARLVFDELPDLPHLVELPGRGPGGDMLGRAAVIALDLPVDLQPSGWRLVPRVGMDYRRARGLVEHDLDALEEAAQGYAGPLKIAVAGPWTLAAGVELTRGHKALSDAGATRDLAEALAAGLAEMLGTIARRVPGARLLVQLDEPSLPAVIAGRVRTPSGFSVVRAVDEGPAAERIALVLAAASGVGGVVGAGVHCCAPDVPLELLRRAGAQFVGLDATLLSQRADEAIGEAVEAGLRLMMGVVPSTDQPGASPPPSPSAGVTADAAADSGPRRRAVAAAAASGARASAPNAARGAAGRLGLLDDGDGGQGDGGGDGGADRRGPELSDPGRTVDPVRTLWRRLGFRPEQLAEVVAVTPTCGLAGASERYARLAMRHCRAAARVLVESPE
ncbi:methionine synthase [Pseudofrankia asymbiotica]|uniref:Methionine synthase n=1 Tax=Pseudofrankia asymbiotica TaxID=1834516 RepID=A0A1V2IFR7_9ACTN|nr:methionine synthase [Pseudofrankia asymbiotica]ONH31301.1 methionine synthase [Pseudofrankia asymbiotica]